MGSLGTKVELEAGGIVQSLDNAIVRLLGLLDGDGAVLDLAGGRCRLVLGHEARHDSRHVLSHRLVQEAVLRLRLDHARALRTNVEDSLLHVNVTVKRLVTLADVIHQEVNSNERSRTSNSRTTFKKWKTKKKVDTKENKKKMCARVPAVDNNRSRITDGLLYLTNGVKELKNRLGLLGNTMIGPGQEMKLSHRSLRSLLAIL